LWARIRAIVGLAAAAASTPAAPVVPPPTSQSEQLPEPGLHIAGLRLVCSIDSAVYELDLATLPASEQAALGIRLLAAARAAMPAGAACVPVPALALVAAHGRA
jgi:hypothetical protein